ncbi:MAG: MFS transporter [Acidobacteriaceae bacterium]|nr:MFS transporter [Acidobacteriaceae bacterium]
MTITEKSVTSDLPSTDSQVVGRLRWMILGMLFFAATINYMDRFLLGMLKPTIMQDLHWKEMDYANVVFSFQLAYAVGLLVMGRIIDKIGVRLGMTAVVAMCALAAASHGFVRSAIGFCLARAALGFGESGTWPGCVKAIGEWFPPKERAFGNGVVNAGSSVGATITPFAVPLILKLVAWPVTFVFVAMQDVLWLFIWLVSYRSPSHHPWLKKSELAYIRSGNDQPQGEVSWWQLFEHRQTWAFLTAKGLTDPVWWFFLFWMPGFLAKQYNLTRTTAASSAAAMALPVMVIYIMASSGSVGGGWLSMNLISRGWSVNKARKLVMLGCALCVVPVFAVSFHLGLWPSVLLIGMASAAHLGFSANLFTVATDTVPRHAVGSVTGIGGVAAALGAMFNAKMIGFVLDKTHSYAIPFAIASVSYIIALGILHLLLPRLEPMQLKVMA